MSQFFFLFWSKFGDVIDGFEILRSNFMLFYFIYSSEEGDVFISLDSDDVEIDELVEIEQEGEFKFIISEWRYFIIYILF